MVFDRTWKQLPTAETGCASAEAMAITFLLVFWPLANSFSPKLPKKEPT